MAEHKMTQLEIIQKYNRLIEAQVGKAVRPFRGDGFVNLINRFGTSKDTTEHYRFAPEPEYPDDVFTRFYEGNGLFAKIIDTPAEEAVKHGFDLANLDDSKIRDFYTSALDELDWDETAMTAIKWARLFGGSIAVMLINDGRGLEAPLNWKNIRSIDDIRVYDRSVITPDYQSMYHYDPHDPFRTRGSRLGMPELYHVNSKWGAFTVHESRCLTFQNGILPENASNSTYQMWGMPEYVRLYRAIRDAVVAHSSAPKLLEKSIQAIYKMKDLALEMSTEEGEDKVLRRLQIIDMARGMLNSMILDADGEDYDFKTFQFNGINDVVSTSCNMLSAISYIPQVILFGSGISGMSSTDDTSMEVFYNYIDRIRNRMVKPNLRYLLSVIFQAGVATGEIDEVPMIRIDFKPLWSLSEAEQADLDLKRAQIQQIKAQTAQTYVEMQAIDPAEVRNKLADAEEFDVENMLDETDDEDLFPEELDYLSEEDKQKAKQLYGQTTDAPGQIAEEGQLAQYAEGVDIEAHNTDPGTEGSASTAAPAATKLPQDMSEEEKAQAEQARNKDEADAPGGVGVLVVKDGQVLVGVREEGFCSGLVCGPGGHIEDGETPEEAAIRETREEFGITPKELLPLGAGPAEPDTGITSAVFLCTDWEGEIVCKDHEMGDPRFMSLEEISKIRPSLFQPFADGLDLLSQALNIDCMVRGDGGPGSGNHGHAGVPGQVGGSAPSGITAVSDSCFPTDRYRIDPNQGWNAERSSYLSGKGFSDGAIKKLSDLTTAHIRGQEPEAEMKKFISENRDLVMAAASYETAAAQKRREYEIAEADKAIASAKEELEAVNRGEYDWMGPREYALQDAEDRLRSCESHRKKLDEPVKLYRKGGYEDTCLSFTTDHNGVVLNAGTDYETYLTPDHEATLQELESQGIFPIGGFGAYFNFYSGEGTEVTFVRVPAVNQDGGPGSGNFGHKGIEGQRGGSLPGNAVQTLMGKATSSPDYQKANSTRKAAVGRMQEIDKKLSSIPTKLPQEKWSESDRELVKLLGRQYAPPNPEWHELHEQKDAAVREWQSAIEEMNEILLKEEPAPHLKDFDRPAPAESDDYDGFQVKDTGTSVDMSGCYVAEMSPKEYLERCAAMFNDCDGRETNLTMQVRQLSRESIDNIKGVIQSGGKVYTPWLDERGINGQEGRHRAAAAYELGIEKIPVVYWASNRSGKGRRKNSDGQEAKTENPLDFKAQSATIKSRDQHHDADDVDWITVNGAHIPLKDGTAVGGGALEGQDFSAASSTSSSPSLAKAHWPDDFPKITVHTNLQTLRHVNPERHHAAKHGDTQAAKEIIAQCVKMERVEELANKYPDAKVVPVRGEDTEEGNQIPMTFASCFEAFGLEVEDGIVQTKKAGHTDSDQFHRLMSRPEFDGKVEPGREYILVDDHVTNGGTLSDLRKYIVSNGGKVVAISTLSASQGGTYIAIQKKTVDQIRAKHGEGIDSLLRKGGIAYDVESLTDKEGRYILSMNPDTLKRRIEEDG